MSTDDTLLSYESIQKIRQYVVMKFSHLSKEKHADILADAIVKVVDNHLPAFSYETKKAITQTIIKQMVVEKKQKIIFNDIIDIVENHPLSLEDKREFSKWYNNHQLLSDDKHLNRLSNNNNEHSLANVALKAKHEVSISVGQATPYSTQHDIKSSKKQSRLSQKKMNLIFTVGFIVLLVVLFITNQINVLSRQAQVVQTNDNRVDTNSVSTPVISQLPKNELPAHYQYVEFDREIIKSYLNTRNSILVEEPYFSAIYNTGLEFNIHPVLLFSITGQEQGFVPRDHEYANEIAQNPFNVFYSWEDYNTNIEDTTAIAARTIVNLSKDRPEDVEAIKWINRKYAEDENWHKGVVWFFETITNHQINK